MGRKTIKNRGSRRVSHKTQGADNNIIISNIVVETDNFPPTRIDFFEARPSSGQIFAIFGAFLKHFDGKFINPLLTTGYTHIRLFYTSKRKNERKKVPRWCCQSAFFSENSLENFASERLSDVVISPF